MHSRTLSLKCCSNLCISLSTHIRTSNVKDNGIMSPTRWLGCRCCSAFHFYYTAGTTLTSHLSLSLSQILDVQWWQWQWWPAITNYKSAVEFFCCCYICCTKLSNECPKPYQTNLTNWYECMPCCTLTCCHLDVSPLVSIRPNDIPPNGSFGPNTFGRTAFGQTWYNRITLCTPFEIAIMLKLISVLRSLSHFIVLI